VSPSPRVAARAMAFEQRSGRILLTSSNPAVTDTWSYAGGVWTLLPTLGPAPTPARLVEDEDRGMVVGLRRVDTRFQVFEFTGNDWQAGATLPGITDVPVYDAGTGSIVNVGFGELRVVLPFARIDGVGNGASLTFGGRPAPGRQLQFTLPVSGVLFVAFQPAQQPGIPITGNLLCNTATALLDPSQAVTIGLGTGWTLRIPVDAALVGLPATFQAAQLGSCALLSNAWTLRVQPD